MNKIKFVIVKSFKKNADICGCPNAYYIKLGGRTIGKYENDFKDKGQDWVKGFISGYCKAKNINMKYIVKQYVSNNDYI